MLVQGVAAMACAERKITRLLIPRSHYRAITTIALIVSDRDIQAKTKI